MSVIDTSREAMERLEIERAEDMDRAYIPLPGGWEIQTKGNGSTLRLLDKKTGERHPLPLGEKFAIAFVERMAAEVNAASRALLSRAEAAERERDEAHEWASGWKGAVDTACTLLGFGGGNGAEDFLSAVQKHADEIRALRAQMAWQPIETAKNGKEVLLIVWDRSLKDLPGEWLPFKAAVENNRWFDEDGNEIFAGPMSLFIELPTPSEAP